MIRHRASAIRKALRATFLYFLIASFGAGNAHAIMAGAANKFQIASPQIAKKVRSIEALRFITSAENVDTLVQEISEFSIILVRLQGSYCEEACITAFFADEVAPENLQGIGLYPPKTTMGDVWTRICKICVRVLPLVFEYESGAQKTVGISKQGVLF